ncbi:MAG TPA: GDSL-type esterase/lipase family protein [Verrucomicrobiae bacterium]|nr:GDSL-type esterase/lipase family protein [Verrucomicrobiae bacterium]
MFLKTRALLMMLAAGLGGCGVGGTSAPAGTTAPTDDGWVGTWGAALHQPAAVDNQSFRMIVHPTLAAPRIRIRFANFYGDAPVTFEAIHAALREAGPAIVAGSDRSVTFNGVDSVTVPVGGEAISDPVDLAVAVGDDVAVSFYVATPAQLSQHGSSTAVSYIASGNHTDEASGTSYTGSGTSWWGLVGIDAERADALGTLVALGDSITDGNSPPDVNNRWPDYFATRLQDAGIAVGVLNAGIGANQVTQDTNFLGSSQAAVTRFDRDVLQRPAVKWLVLFEGTNDLAQGITADAVYAGLQDIAQRARGQGIHVIVGTITPRGKDPTWQANPALEEQRVALNDLIRAGVPGDFDQLADFDVALALPSEPSVMAPEYDSGDGLHPGPVGLQRIAAEVPVDALN